MEEKKKINCWEFKKCGKEKNCPAYSYHGRICWYIAGTFCGGKVQGEYAKKIKDCRKCEFYIKLVLKKEI
jgi:hypothetical protein